METTKYKYAIVWIKSGNCTPTLHSDGHFYGGTISMRGCHQVTYKTKAGAERKAREYAHCKEGIVLAVQLDGKEMDDLQEDLRENGFDAIVDVLRGELSYK